MCNFGRGYYDEGGGSIINDYKMYMSFLLSYLNKGTLLQFSVVFEKIGSCVICSKKVKTPALTQRKNNLSPDPVGGGGGGGGQYK